MDTFTFDLHFTGAAGERTVDALFEAGWDDATVSFDPAVGGHGIATFDRAARTAAAAVASAISEGQKAGVEITSVTENLVPLANVARRVQLKRRVVRQRSCRFTGMSQGDPTLVLDFTAHGLPGRVSVSCGRNEDPGNMGMGMLGLDDGTGNWARDFPVVEASVEYSGDGYKMVMGWIQTVRVTHADGSVEQVVDRLPQLADVDQPSCSWGPRPTFFDAPATTDRPIPEWRADTFLTLSPDTVMTKSVRPVCAFHWGYMVGQDGTVTPQWPTSDGLRPWRDIVALLRAEHPNWSFAES